MEQEDAWCDSGSSPPDAPAEAVAAPSPQALGFWDEVERLYGLLARRKEGREQCIQDSSPPSTLASVPSVR